MRKDANASGDGQSPVSQEERQPAASGQDEINREFIRLELQLETSMAKVISLLERQSRMPRRVQKEPVEAKILLFTGVRYERLDVTSNRPGTGPKRAKNK
ncbi:hypothetical protein DTW90_11570 [Neorhizobium sp. P12A]|nr:hypothetical protein DTW90_11570 [Neorhizobium sp. P12A]